MTWSGLYTPLVTPFKEGKLDEEGLKSLIRFQIESGVEGIVLLGTTGESASLSLQEKEKILTIAKQEAGRSRMIVGTGSNSTHATIEATLQAQDVGADAVLIIAPYYNKPTQEGLFKHFESVALATSLPIIVYNNPTRTGVNIEPATLRKIASLPHIVGVKESPKELQQVIEVIAQVKPHYPTFSVLSGEDSWLLPLLALGCDGAIASAANVIPRPLHQLIVSCQHNRWDEARKNFYKLLPLLQALSCETNPIPLKYAMQFVGLPAGEPRLPLTPLSLNNRKKVEEALHEVGI